ncbi:Threonylcarbamoyl-AMP synthase [Planctomycetes bacterium Poly30]|uniref:Threonylcarbamoyl-AMP synthase n=1 Tax=Saltatorellus ferox TaxID=2528018 RepID=A0A518ELP8_9BACT|nr:Threonylcarbamoyl-AMP synthase [Planctomycetes bacterium Poly30]
MSAPVLEPDDEAIARAVRTLRGGGLVAMPTETVYGLACDASHGQAIARLYDAKGRPSFNPLIAHVADEAMARREAGGWDGQRGAAARLSAAFWPGPLTLVMPFATDTGSVSDLARAGLPTIALRQPDHPVAQRLIRAFGGPLVAPSANPSGRMSPTRAEHVAAEMGDLVDLILDGGACRVGLESTIVSLVGMEPALLRPGGLDPSDLEQVLGRPLRQGGDRPDAPSSPGQLLRHYAPRARLRLNAIACDEGEVFLGFGSQGVSGSSDANLSPSGSLIEAAANLFTLLRALDDRATAIAVAPIPTIGLGLAINDRLQRAARRE